MQIEITNGTGSAQILSGTYSVSSETKGYDDSSISPSSVSIDKTTDEYSFTIAASGTLTLHVTDDGTILGIPIVGATFKRCDSLGNEYGSVITTDSNGNANFEHVPFDTTGVNVYYKQLSSDSQHEFDDTLKTISLTEETSKVEIGNPAAKIRTIKLVDQYYSGYPIESSIITLS